MKKLLSLLLAVMIVVSLLPTSALANESRLTKLPLFTEQEQSSKAEPAEDVGNIDLPKPAAADTHAITVADIETNITLAVGGLYTLKLPEVFSDSRNHSMSYKIVGIFGSQAGITEEGVFKFTMISAGEYKPKIVATCDDDPTVTAALELKISVKNSDSGNENPAQYGYNETPADRVSVIVTISSDGIPIKGKDGTVLSHMNVTVPYFDLGLYGLEDYYRYHTDGGKGPYIDKVVVERPTAMHLFIYMLERYYIGIPEENCCKGTSGVLEYNEKNVVKFLNGETAYIGEESALYYTGGATSTYMESFWGHDQNLMYYRNHVFPLMSEGWGSSSDYQLLSDNDTIDLAMFSNWDFYNGGAFCCFNKESYTVEAGEPLGFNTKGSSTSQWGSAYTVPITGLKVRIYDEKWNLIDELESETPSFQYNFNKAGVYHLVGMDANAGTDEAARAPATAVVTVTDGFAEYPFASLQTTGGMPLPKIETRFDIENVGHYHVSVPSGTSEVKIIWKDDAELSGSYDTYKIGGGDYNQNAGTLTVEGNSVTVNPADWSADGNAIILKNGDGNFLGAFTFEFYTASGVNFPPIRKGGVPAFRNLSVRIDKPYLLDLSTIFEDPDGNPMTYAVSVDGGDFTATDKDYSYTPTKLGSAKLVFRAEDSLGAVGEETYTLNLTVRENALPVLIDEASGEKTVRINEYAAINLLAIFNDPDEDELTYEYSRDGGKTYESFVPYEWVERIYNSATTTVAVPHKDFRYTQSELGDVVFLIRARDDKGFGAVYTFIAHFVENQAPVPKQEYFTEDGMVNHYWFFDIVKAFTDPEGDEMTYTVSIDDGEPITIARPFPLDSEYIFYTYVDGSSGHRFAPLLTEEKEYKFVFTATDSKGSSGSCTCFVNAKPEEIHEVTVTDNTFPSNLAGKAAYSRNEGQPDTWITGYKVTDEVLVRRVRYSEYKGFYNYYIDLDGTGLITGQEFQIEMEAKPSFVGKYNFVGPKLGEYYEETATFKAENYVQTERFAWHSQHPNANYTSISDNWLRYRFCISVLPDEKPNPVSLSVVLPRDELYVGEKTSDAVVKCTYDDGRTRRLFSFTTSPTSFDEAGSKNLSVSGGGLTVSVPVKVNEVPSYTALLDNYGPYGRARCVTVTDKNGNPIEGATLTLGEVTYETENFDYSTYEQRRSLTLQLTLPGSIESGEGIELRFELINHHHYAHLYIAGENAAKEKTDYGWYCTLPITLNGNSGTANAYYVDCNITDNRGTMYHWYDAMPISWKIGDDGISGKISFWGTADDAEILVYDAAVSDGDIRADVKGERTKALAKITDKRGEVTADGKRSVQEFFLSGLKAGSYKLAVYKPGKYVVAVSKEIALSASGTTDCGLITLWLLGDVNNNGNVTFADSTQILRYVSKKRTLNEEEMLAADINNNGNVTFADSTQILRYIARKPSLFDNYS